MAKKFYDVQLKDQPEPIRVEIRFPDMVVAEREAPRYGIIPDPSVSPMLMTVVWVWCALRRMGHGVGEFPTFQNDMFLDLDPVDVDPEAPPLDPTQPAAPTISP